MAQLVKNPPAMQETWVQSLGWEDPQEKGKATHSTFWPGEFHGLYSRLSHFSHVRLCATPQMAAHQAPPSLGFSRQEHEWVAIFFSNA